MAGVFAALMAAPASACAIGGEQTFFAERPTDTPPDLQIIRGRLLLKGGRVNLARARSPESNEGSFIGFIHETGRPWRDALPVYVAISSCHHVGPEASGRTVYLMGRVREADGRLPRRFVAESRRYY